MKTLQKYIQESKMASLTEASLGRLKQHRDAGEPMAIISACRSDWDRKNPNANAQMNNAKTQELRTFILGAGFGFNKTIGGYTEVQDDGTKVEIKDEKSQVVYATPDREKELRTFAIGMGRRFKQDSILFVDCNGNAEWIFTRKDNFMGKPIASSMPLGKFKATQVGQYFTKIGKKNFSFVVESEDIRRYTQLAEEQAIPTTIEMRGLDYMRQTLAKCVESGEDWYKTIENVWTD